MRQLALRCLGPRAAPPHRYGNTWERRGDGEERERERLGGRSEGMETSVCWKGAIDLSKVSHRSDVNPLLPEPRVLRSQNEYSNYRWKKNNNKMFSWLSNIMDIVSSDFRPIQGQKPRLMCSSGETPQCQEERERRESRGWNLKSWSFRFDWFF